MPSTSIKRKPESNNSGLHKICGCFFPFTQYNNFCCISAEIAQLVEHFTRNEGVVGSSPIFSLKKMLSGIFFVAKTPASVRRSLLLFISDVRQSVGKEWKYRLHPGCISPVPSVSTWSASSPPALPSSAGRVSLQSRPVHPRRQTSLLFKGSRVFLQQLRQHLLGFP